MADELTMRNPESILPYGPSWPQLLDKVRKGLMVWTHSAKVRPGDVFVALPGSRSDGGAFVPEALGRGAGYVVARSSAGWPAGAAATLIIHPDPRLALGELARAYFKTDRLPFKLVGVTGTNGKTTISYLVEHLLASNGQRVGVVGTVSYRWPSVVLEAQMTTPDCWKLHELLANMARSQVDVAVMETSSHALDQNRVAGLAFDVGVMTNLTQDHLDYHRSMEDYFRAKAKLFSDFAAGGMTSILNYEDPACARLLEVAPNPVGYGIGAPPPGRYTRMRGTIHRLSAAGLELSVTYNGGMQWTLASALIGRHNALNLLAAQAVGLALGLSPKDLRHLAAFPGVPGRLERVANARGLNVFVDFAHTPDALINVLSAVKPLTQGRLFVVFGCGGDRDRGKRPLMAAAVARFADVAVLTSDNPRHEEPNAIMADARPGLAGCPRIVEEPDRRQAIALALSELKPLDVLVVAGKGHETYQQIGDEKRPFSDSAVIREILGCA